MPLLRGTCIGISSSRSGYTPCVGACGGETVELKWDNDGLFIPYGKQGATLKTPKGYEYRPGRQDGVYAALGRRRRRCAPRLRPRLCALLVRRLGEHRLLRAGRGKAALHPARRASRRSSSTACPRPMWRSTRTWRPRWSSPPRPMSAGWRCRLTGARPGSPCSPRTRPARRRSR